MNIKTLMTAGTFFGLMASTALADCGPADQSIRILGNDFPAIQAVGDAAEEKCAGQAAEFTRNHTNESRNIMNAALTPDPAEYSAVIVANQTLTQLMNDGLVRPLNDLIEEHGQNIPSNLQISLGGDVMAIAFMANSQHIYARSDILEQAGVSEVPTTYKEVLDAAEAIREAGIMEHPLVMNAKVGWDLAELFNTVYMAHQGEFFEAGTANPSIEGEAGIATLELMAKLTEYANPDHLSQASNETQAIWEAGQAALGIMWGSRAAGIIDDEGSTPEVTENTVLAAAPSVEGIGVPGATLWWDGFVISANIPDEQAEATFAALASALNPEMIAANNDAAVWLVDGFEPGPAAAGVSATASGGARPYPMVPQMGLLHAALSTELADFMQGNESAEQALADVVSAYSDAAREAGFLE